MAFSKGPLSEGYFDAIALVAEDVEQMALTTNRQRAMAIAKAKAGFGD